MPSMKQSHAPNKVTLPRLGGSRKDDEIGFDRGGLICPTSTLASNPSQQEVKWQNRLVLVTIGTGY